MGDHYSDELPDLQQFEALQEDLQNLGIDPRIWAMLPEDFQLYLVRRHQDAQCCQRRLQESQERITRLEFDSRRLRLQRDVLRARYLKEHAADPLDGHTSAAMLQGLPGRS